MYMCMMFVCACVCMVSEGQWRGTGKLCVSSGDRVVTSCRFISTDPLYLVRLSLCVCVYVYAYRLGGVELDDVRLTRDEIKEMRESGALPPTKEIPVAFLSYVDERHVKHELVMAQSVSILRTVGKLSSKKLAKRGIPGIIARVASSGVTVTPIDLYPENLFLSAKVDEMLDFVSDSFETIVPTFFPNKFGINDFRNKKQQIKMRQRLSTMGLPKTLGAIENILPESLKGVHMAPATEDTSAKSSSSWLTSCVGMNGSAVDEEEDVWSCGTEMLTIADIWLCCWLNFITSGWCDGISTTIVDEFPGLSALQKKFNTLPEIKAYYTDMLSKYE